MARTASTSELIEQLSASRSEKRLSAARNLRRHGHVEAGPAILDALQRELKDIRTWNAQHEMILALGELRCREALPLLWELAARETPHTILYSALGDAIVRLGTDTQVAIENVFRVIGTGNYPLMHGAFHAMAMLRLVPTNEQIERIQQAASDPRAEMEVKGSPTDRTGNRLWVAIAAAGWPRDLVRPFLEECLAIPDQGLQLAATNSLKGKYTKWANW
jgi:HEAT repeat protein